MKLLCINTDNVRPGTLNIGQDYDITEVMPGSKWYEANNVPVSLSNFEGIKDRLKRLSLTATKMILATPSKGVTVDILLTDKYIIIYGHTKGNHWNISGSHYKYYHDIDTGEFIPDCEVQKHDKSTLKERLLMADYKYIISNIQKNKTH